MVQRLDEGMQSLAEVIKKTTGKDITNYPGAGAARGMGGGLLAFFNAELKPGTELLLKAIDFSEKIKGADLIITGEGKADRQTAMGKVPYGRQYRKPAGIKQSGIQRYILYSPRPHHPGEGNGTGVC